MIQKINVKVFREDEFDDLEKDINEWLNKHDTVEVVDIKFTKYIYDWGYNDVISSHIAIIIYIY